MVSPLTVRGAPLRLAPEIFAAELASWVNFGRPPKDRLLAAILKNDLGQVIALGADWPLVHAIQIWLWSEAPPACFGSAAAVRSWQLEARYREATRVTDGWTFWKRAIKDPKSIGTRDLQLYVDQPEIGYWRYFDKRTDRWVPVAYFLDEDDVLRCHVGGKDIEARKMGDIWHRCCQHPITYEAYQSALGGQGFADEPPPRGHNLSADQHEQLTFERDEAVELAKTLLGKELNVAVADQLAILSKRLSTIRAKADQEHDREKRPHLEAGRDVDDKWRPLREGVTAFVTQLKQHLKPWLESHGDSAGRTGATVSLRRVFVGEIVDVFAFFKAVHEHPDIQEALQKVANALAKQKAPTPGMKIKEEARAI